MAADMTVVKAQVDAELKRRAEVTLKALGLDMASGIRMFISQVVLKGGIPFDVTMPKLTRETLEAIADAYEGRTEKSASVADLLKKAGVG